MREDPALDTVVDADDAVFQFVIAVAFRVSSGADREFVALDIGRVQGVAENLVAWRNVLGQGPESAHPRIPDQRFVNKIPFPDADLAGFQCEQRAFKCSALLACEVRRDARRRIEDPGAMI